MNKILQSIRILVACLFIFVIISTISAGFPYDDYDTKWQLCSAMNLNGSNCDVWWNAYADFPVSNETQIDLSGYYNKTEIDKLLTQIATANYTIGNQTGNISGYVTQSYFDNWTSDFRAGILNNTPTKQEFDNLKDNFYDGDNNFSLENINPLWIIIILIVFGIVVFVAKNKNKIKTERTRKSEIDNIETDEEKSARYKLEAEKLDNKKKNKAKKK